MTDEELRVKLADWVRPAAELQAPGILVLRRRVWRRRARNATASLMSAAVVATVVVLAAVTVQPTTVPAPRVPATGWAPAGPAAAPDAGPGSSPFTAQIDVSHDPVSVVISDVLTGKVLARVTSPLANAQFTGVAAAADDRTFFLAVTGPGVVVYELRLTGTGKVRSLSRVLTIPASGITDFAVSPSGRMLAYTGGQGITTRSLPAGTSRTWRVPGTVSGLSWGNDQRLAYSSTGPGNSVATRILGTPMVIPGVQVSLMTEDGKRLFGLARLPSAPTAQLAEYSAETGKRLATIAHTDESGHGSLCAALWSDPSGTQAAGTCGTGWLLHSGRVTPLTLYGPFGQSSLPQDMLAW